MRLIFLFLTFLVYNISIAQKVDFQTEVQPIFTNKCARCHPGNANMNLRSGNSYNNIVDKASNNYSPALRIDRLDSLNSVLWNKIAGTGVNGQLMPRGGPKLPQKDISTIARWISELEQISVNQEMFNIGDALIGDTTLFHIQITNASPVQTLNISSVVSTVSAFVPVENSFSIAGGSNNSLEILFLPDSSRQYSGTLRITNADPTEPVTQIQISGTGIRPAPEIALSDSSLDFGDVLYTNGTYLPLTIKNGGTRDLIVSEIIFSDKSFDTTNAVIPQMSSQERIPLIIVPQDSLELFITFQPDTIRSYSDTLTIRSDDSLNPEIRVLLTGNGVTGAHNVEPLSLNFGGVQVSDSSTDTVYVSNVGTVDLLITITPPEIGEFNTFPFYELISTNGVLTVPVVFTPSAEAEFSDVLIVSSPAGVDTVTLSGNGIIVGVDDEKISPEDFTLFQNYPNPFNPMTIIIYTLPKEYDVTLTIFNLQGEEIAKLVEGNFNAGEYSIEWDASNIPSGIYFYRLQARQTDVGQARDFVQTKKMVLLK